MERHPKKSLECSPVARLVCRFDSGKGFLASVGRLRNWRMRGSDDRSGSKESFYKTGGPVAELETFVDRHAYQNLRHGGIVRVAFRSCFYTQFDELLASPLLAVLLFGLLRMRVTN